MIKSKNLNSTSRFDLSLITFESSPLFHNTSDRFNVSIQIGTLPDQTLVAAKIYTAKDETSLSELFDAICEEVKILSILSNRANNDNCFIKIFRITTKRKSAYIYMEAHEKNLMTMLSDWKKHNFKPPQDILDRWIISLIESYADLTNMKIAHRDIKPHNILVTYDWRLKIIDFGVSKIGREYKETISETGTHSIQGTKGYMAPELVEMLDRGIRRGDYNLEKADVFSLGLIILQIITYDDLYSLNMKQNNRQLLDKVAGLNASDWIKNMLACMLVSDWSQRLSFKDCFRYIPVDYRITELS